VSNQGLHLEQGLQQTIAPQMQQSLQILQTATVELGQLVRQEMAINPVLEHDVSEASLEELSEGEDGFEEDVPDTADEDAEWLELLSQSPPSTPTAPSADEDERRQFQLDSLVAPISLQSDLGEQLKLSGVAPEVFAAAEILIGEIDDHGFLEVDLEDLCFSMSIPMPDLEAARNLIQSFDPPGVGAADIRESLMLQLHRLGKLGKLPYRIVEGYLDELAKRRFSGIARSLGVAPEQVVAAAEEIADLEPRPARNFSSKATVYVAPDVICETDPESPSGYSVRLTNEYIPQLKISNTYRDMLAESDGDLEARDYIREKIRGGKFLIRSIHQRQDTILRIATEIVKRQADFLREGEDHLRPMNMAQIAEVIGVHETTVSRAVSAKYMQTPRGLYELKFFFTSGYQTDDGVEMSNLGVKNAIAEMVAAEDPSKPLSDQKIVEELAESGIPIARRTVAKYRDALHILPSHLRRSL